MQDRIDGKLFIISAPSAGGKTTIINKLLDELSGKLRKVVTCTTREKREGEKEGIDYKFLSDSRFDSLLEEGAFIEHAEVYGNRYGVLKKDIEGSGNKIISLDSTGVENFKRMNVKATYILIKPPSIEVLEARLKSRGSESDEEISLRLKEAQREIDMASMYDWSVINDQLEEAIDRCKQIIMGEIN